MSERRCRRVQRVASRRCPWPLPHRQIDSLRYARFAPFDSFDSHRHVFARDDMALRLRSSRPDYASRRACASADGVFAFASRPQDVGQGVLRHGDDSRSVAPHLRSATRYFPRHARTSRASRALRQGRRSKALIRHASASAWPCSTITTLSRHFLRIKD
jgi:hypothetical protein